MPAQITINFNDEIISIIDDDVAYVDTFAYFGVDAGRGVPPYPDEWHYLTYKPGDARLIVFLDDGSQVERKNPEYRQFVAWATGALQTIIDAKSRRNPDTNAPPPDSVGDRFIALEKRCSDLELEISKLKDRLTVLESTK